MRSTAIRWGYLLVVLLTLLAMMGWRVQEARRSEARLRAANQALRAERLRLLAERARLTSPEALLRWAESHGFVPLPEGAWR